MKREPELLQKLVDGIQEYGTIKNACRACGVSKAAFFNWCKQSGSDGGEEFMVSVGEERMLFSDAVRMAQRQVSFEVLESFRLRLLRGTDEISRFQGKTVYKRDPALDHLSDQDLEDLGITTRYLRDADGEFIPETIHHEPSVQGVLAFLAAEFPKQWGNKSTVEINQRSTGVQVVSHRFAPKPSLPPVQEVAPVAAIDAPIIDVEPDDVGPDDLADLLGEELVAEQPELAPVAKLVAPAPVTEPRLARPAQVSELTRDLLDRLARRPGADRAAPLMSPSVFRPEADDLDPRRTGAGSGPPPGAIKVV
ncbi:hypothetical protein [Bradyrhizobium sp. CW11]|uniref:hypothetical protein n=1 Tax=Bradyrhizobium sp. CW11 TaxID=2782684 RepID=UPI001FF8FA22|nr:hypothetical protein [Bradyrhizobium sp. CW11]MCK1346028.1 hypothetical protein [Bradyrhizobium sp. CW11]